MPVQTRNRRSNQDVQPDMTTSNNVRSNQFHRRRNNRFTQDRSSPVRRTIARRQHRFGTQTIAQNSNHHIEHVQLSEADLLNDLVENINTDSENDSDNSSDSSGDWQQHLDDQTDEERLSDDEREYQEIDRQLELAKKLREQQMKDRRETLITSCLTTKSRKPLPDMPTEDELVRYGLDFPTCPITLQPLRDPVIASDGFTYEREAITKWLIDNKNSPCTNLELKQVPVYPNNQLACVLHDLYATLSHKRSIESQC